MEERLRLRFLGASGTVTGSKYLLEACGHKILIDCGLFQGEKALRLRNWEEPPFDVQQLSAVVLTHAHIDHSGYLPLLVRRGYRGPVYCTPSTKELLALLLPDSAHLQEEEARYANKHGTSKHKPALPLYTSADAARALEHLAPFEFGEAREILPGIVVSGVPAGHILGPTALHVQCGARSLAFSGDLGRYHAPIMKDPAPLDLGELLVCESTYGDRLHPESDVKEELAEVVREAAADGGALIVPAFALGRTQTLLYLLAQLERERRVPQLPVFVDSPMAVDATNIYIKHRNEYDEEAGALLASGKAVLKTARTVFCRSVQESKRLNDLGGARIVISASGMATGGRILHHLQRGLGDRRNMILLVGYQAEGTRGRTIESGADSVKIFGQAVPIRAKVRKISGLSAHADKAELLRWLKSCRGAPGMVKIVHGEKNTAETFAATVRRELGWNASAARDGEVLDL